MIQRRKINKKKEEEEKAISERTLNVIAVTGKMSAKFITFEIDTIDEPEINYGVTLRKYLYDYT